ncbi:hypothetical protein PG990_009305 [Apiospora arundinis]|uniref:Uncharacterized protein n=1 Tax=Apiospora arundinis TaxID=335852 RepID=A0ABR2IIL3_9PEZI
MIEWIRHVKRHDNLESEVDKTFIREKIIELYRRVDEELVWAHPKPQASRTQRSQKRTREATEIDSDQPRSQQPKRIRRAITNTHDEQARQEDLFSPHIPSSERVIASGNEITDYTSIETSYTAGAFSSLPYSIPDDHNAQATPSQCIDLIPLPGQMASLGPDSAFMNSQHMPNGPSQNINSYPIHLQEFPLPDQLALYMPPIFRALNYPQ